MKVLVSLSLWDTGIAQTLFLPSPLIYALMPVTSTSLVKLDCATVSFIKVPDRITER